MVVQNVSFGESEISIHSQGRSFARYPAEKVIPAVAKLGRSRIFVMVNGSYISIKRNNQKYAVFGKSCVCAKCGRVGNMASIDKQNGVFFVNLYSVKNGKAVLMTKDHIHPKSKGGRDTLDNYQTMCYPCNSRKGAKVC